MRCTSPRTVGYSPDGRRVYSYRQADRGLASHPAPCGKCLECRLAYASEAALRCYHESQLHERNCFITLTYSDEHLKSSKLIYSDFQAFMKRLRKLQNDPIGLFVTGEYGEENKRPHWHAIIFNWRPSDPRDPCVSKRGDTTCSSDTLDKLWGKGRANFGDVTLESAGYCARYAAKKLVHGKDQDHEFHPVHKRSSKNAIGKRWIEKYWEYVFSHGRVNLPNGGTAPIPRYYERWLKREHPEQYERYVTGKKCEISLLARERSENDNRLIQEVNSQRLSQGKLSFARSASEARRMITQSKFKLLQDNLKL